MVLHLKTFKNSKYRVKKLSNLEKITNIFFSIDEKKLIKI